MSRFNLAEELKNAVLGLTGKGLRLFASRVNNEAGWMWGWGATVPADGAATGFTTGALFLNITNGLVYQQKGTMASANFDLWGTGSSTAYENIAWHRPWALGMHVGYIGAVCLVSRAATIMSAWGTLQDPSTGAAVEFDVERSVDNGGTWASIFSTRPTIDAGERTTTTAATPNVLAVTALNINDLLRSQVIVYGTLTSNLTIGLELRRT